MLSSLTRPFYDMLRQWIYDGELSDPYNEFFVIEADPDNETYRDLDPKQIAAASVWENKYKLNQRLVPSIISDELAKKIFLIGKSLNFIRYSCGDASWVEAYSKDASRELKYGDTATLESSIDKAYKTTMARLLHLMNDKFQLLRHLRAMKSYLLLSQGDFVALLMEAVAKNLEKPAVAQYRHTLTAALDHAIRGSNAHFEAAETLSHLDARLLELSHGDIGWDVFTLDYRIDAPVDVVVTTWASKQYLSVFNFLWRIKRVEHALGSSWQRTTTGARGVLKTVGKDLEKDWKTVRCCIGEMVHFVNQLQYYILFEVIEASWNELQVAFTKPDSTLDDLITAHTSYIKGITHKGLLGGEKSMLTGNKDESFLSQLHFLLKLMLSYKDAVDGLYSFCVAEFTRQQETAAKIETRTAAGKWGVTESNDYDDRSSPVFGMRRGGTRTSEVESPITAPNWLTTANDDQMLPSLRKRLEELSKEFRNRVELLLGDLRAQEDVELKFLGVVMNFNDVYMPGSRKKEKEFEKGKDVVVGERDREKKGRRGKDKSVSLMDTPSTVRTVRGMR